VEADTPPVILQKNEDTDMASHRIDCITKPNRQSTHEHITFIGSTTEGKGWSREQAIRLIDGDIESFYVKVGNDRSEVGVVRPNDGRSPYLRTYADGKWDDNLLSLDECVLA